ncbi:AMP-binding protein [Meiothermus hypogaeus]|uniref:acetate--CoA ligase n=2 Tax=Meiothermus hypogaeus TaxID=884155 RepID=A0A511R1B1_9DEIN|nr:AMP-binding protein [Meiothermus hypogaeus]RIH76722.1 Acetyl-coenzyme A synthetase [Meiothermus hypogaeus]GEM83400.1 AMP-dependent synthetase [Meiothermus hypogaeus NBRC 106114]
MSEPIWFPSDNYKHGSHIEAMLRNLNLDSYEALYAFSIQQPEAFWEATLQLLGIEWFVPYRQVLDVSQGPQWPQWFVGGQLNLAYNTLHHARTRPHDPALVWEGEDGAVVRLSYGELEAAVAQAAHALKEMGIGKGDRVGLFLPMLPETAISALAVAQIGAIFVPIFSGYAAEAAATRLQDAEARLIITADGFYRRGSRVKLLDNARAAAALSPSVEKLLVVRRFGNEELAPNEVAWDQIVPQQPSRAAYEPMGSMDPFMLIYTSGTTGKPKGTVHYHVGFPIKAAQDMAHLFDLQKHETLFWFTDMGWMMGPWAILGALTIGGTVLLYEGAPDYPDAGRLWAICQRHGVTHLGLSPTLVRALMPLGDEHVLKHNLSRLRMLGSTGEPWNLEPYLWFFKTVGQRRIPIINYSGGTEIGGGILGCTAWRPIKPMGFNTAVPGIHAEVLDSTGQPVRDEVGELVVMAPWPGQTKGFWKAPERYLDTYWNRFENIWVHGDWAILDLEGHWIIQGRSDDTLKIAGKRVGPAEYESAAVEHPAVKEAAAIGIPHPVKGESAVVFVVLRSGQTPHSDLAQAISETIANRLGKALKPDKILFVPDLPKTRNAKVMRRVIRAAYLGQNPGDLSALENPQAVEAIQKSSS